MRADATLGHAALPLPLLLLWSGARASSTKGGHTDLSALSIAAGAATLVSASARVDPAERGFRSGALLISNSVSTAAGSFATAPCGRHGLLPQVDSE